MPATTSSLTALALAPGVLNTTIPRSVHAATGILLTPAPALPTAKTPSVAWASASLKLRNRIASGDSTSSPTENCCPSKRSKPFLAILLRVRTLCITRRLSKSRVLYTGSDHLFTVNSGVSTLGSLSSAQILKNQRRNYCRLEPDSEPQQNRFLKTNLPLYSQTRAGNERPRPSRPLAVSGIFYR